MEMIRRALAGVGVAFLAALALAGPAAAANGAGTTTLTEHFRNEVFFSEEGENPCTGEPGTLTAIAKNGVFHATTQADGEFWVTGTFEGTATFTPADPGGVSGVGHFTAWFGGAGNQKNSVEHDTSTFHLVGSDGSRITTHMTDHLSTNAHGEITASFEKVKMTCG